MAAPTPVWTILSIIAGSLVFAALITLFVLWLVTTIFRRSRPFQIALDTANASKAAAGLFGGIIRPQGFTTGRIRMMGRDGTASLHIPVRGPVAQGRLDVAAYYHSGEWHLRSLKAKVKDGMESVDLLAG